MLRSTDGNRDRMSYGPHHERASATRVLCLCALRRRESWRLSDEGEYDL